MSFERAVGARRPGKVSEDPPAAPGFNVPVPASPRLRTMTGEGARRILHTGHTVLARCIRVPKTKPPPGAARGSRAAQTCAGAKSRQPVAAPRVPVAAPGAASSGCRRPAPRVPRVGGPGAAPPGTRGGCRARLPRRHPGCRARVPGRHPGCRARVPGRHLGCRRTIPYLRNHIRDTASYLLTFLERSSAALNAAGFLWTEACVVR